MKKERKTMYVALYEMDDTGTIDFFIFIADEFCDKIEEFKKAYKEENGIKYKYNITINDIFDIKTAYDYKKNKLYNINLT